MKSFLWSAILESLPTADNLNSRDKNLPQDRPFCQIPTETASHVLLHCLNFTTQVWSLVFGLFSVNWSHSHSESIRQSFFSWVKRSIPFQTNVSRAYESPLSSFPSGISGKKRNERVFDPSSSSPFGSLRSLCFHVLYIFLLYINVF